MTDSIGVALAAAQALATQLEQKDAVIAALEARLAELEERIEREAATTPCVAP